jgi:hypothetical protein
MAQRLDARCPSHFLSGPQYSGPTEDPGGHRHYNVPPCPCKVLSLQWFSFLDNHFFLHLVSTFLMAQTLMFEISALTSPRAEESDPDSQGYFIYV